MENTMLENIPSESIMTDLLGKPLYDVWLSLCSVIDERYDMERSWNSGGKNWTYEYKYRRGGKYHDGKWVMFYPGDESLFSDFMRLLAIKRKPNKIQ